MNAVMAICQHQVRYFQEDTVQNVEHESYGWMGSPTDNFVLRKESGIDTLNVRERRVTKMETNEKTNNSLTSTQKFLLYILFLFAVWSFFTVLSVLSFTMKGGA